MLGGIGLIRADSTNFRALTAFYAEVWASTYQETLGSGEVAAMLESLSQPHLGALLSGDGDCLLIAHETSRIVGTIVYSERSPTMYIWGLYILPKRQRQGIGSMLLHKALGARKSATEAEIHVMSSSFWAVNFYRQHGFIEAGTEDSELLPGMTREVVVMRKNLA